MSEVPLCVDLDGTLLKTDTLLEAFMLLLRQKPAKAIQAPFWLARGKAGLKQSIAREVSFRPEALPTNGAFLEYLRGEHARGRELYLVTGADQAIGTAVAGRFPWFARVFASEGTLNLTGRNKAALLERHFGPQGFDYAGNSRTDLPVWRAARRCVVVNASGAVERAAQQLGTVDHVFDRPRRSAGTWARVFRVHQWTKNLLVFAPLAGSHNLTDPLKLVKAGTAFGAFCLCASSVYMLNDLLDLEADRHHPYKQKRPFAAGTAPLAAGVVLAPLLLAGGFALAYLLGGLFLAAFAFYYVMTVLYSFRLKQLAIVDVMVLAGLYTIRVVAGGFAAQVMLTDWLIVFSIFIFTSLAFAKRFTELQVALQQNKENLKGRGYRIPDLELVRIMGVSSGYLAVMLMASYVNTPVVRQLYHCPKLLWLVCPVLLYWISRIWLLAHRRQLDDDPIVFALKDRESWLVCAAVLLIAFFATIL